VKLAVYDIHNVEVQRVLILTPVPTNIPNGTGTSSEIDVCMYVYSFIKKS